MWMKDVFGTDKPIIGVLHMHALPTDPKWDPKTGIQGVLEAARADLRAYQDGGIDGVLFCNEFSIPYTSNVGTVTVASMARIIGELKSEIRVPIGVTVAADAMKGFDLAAAVEADFLRGGLHGAHAGVYGASSVDPGAVERHRYAVGCGNVKKEVVKTLTFNLNPDTLLIYSNRPGSSIDTSLVERVKAVTDTPVFASNGVKVETVKDILKVCDGAVVATGIKYDGKFFNPVDPQRVKDLMKNAREARGNI